MKGEFDILVNETLKDIDESSSVIDIHSYFEAKNTEFLCSITKYSNFFRVSYKDSFLDLPINWKGVELLAKY